MDNNKFEYNRNKSSEILLYAVESLNDAQLENILLSASDTVLKAEVDRPVQLWKFFKDGNTLIIEMDADGTPNQSINQILVWMKQFIKDEDIRLDVHGELMNELRKYKARYVVLYNKY